MDPPSSCHPLRELAGADFAGTIQAQILVAARYRESHEIGAFRPSYCFPAAKRCRRAVRTLRYAEGTLGSGLGKVG